MTNRPPLLRGLNQQLGDKQMTASRRPSLSRRA